MPSLTRTGIIAILTAGFLALAVGCSDPKSKSYFNSDTGKHVTDWASPQVHGASAKEPSGFSTCADCHSADFSGGISNTSCFTCHGVSAPHPSVWRTGTRTHQTTDESNAPVCATCHANGANSPIALATPAPAGTAPGCFNNTLCHGEGHPAGWNLPDQHGASAKLQPGGFSTCQSCHGNNFAGNTATTCLNTAGCHGAGVNAPHSFPWRSTSTRKHSTANVANAPACGLCHLANRQPPSYVALSVPVGCFDNTLCHGPVGHAVGWAAPAAHGTAAKSAPSISNMTGFSSCQPCHGNNFTGNTATTCLNTAGCHGPGVNAPHSFPWQSTSTRKHSTANVANAPACGLCHLANRQPPSYVVLTVSVGCYDNTLCHGQVGHAVGWAAPAAHGDAAKSAPSVSNVTGFSSCQPCHGNNFAGGTATTCLNTAGCHGVGVNSPHAKSPWVGSVTSTLTHTSTNTANVQICGGCHEGEPTNGNHPYNPPVAPMNCFNNTLCHGVKATTCVGCHVAPQGTRDAVVGEFGLAWGHKKAGRGAVTDADCIVCHLEGNFATQLRSGVHADGNIDLRDPDGADETPITNISGGSFTFTKFATSYAAGSRTSTGHTANTIDNVLTQKFCLACHDGNGATNPTARTTGGTQYMPWGGVNLGANYTIANDAAVAGGVIDVKSQFAVANSSSHPVLGPNTRDFPYSTRLAAPYNNIGTARDSNGTTGHTTAQSVVLNCFDCHNVSGASPLTNRTVAAHGNAQTLRGTIYVANPTLCLICHTGTYSGAVQHHGAGSAWAATGSNHGTSVMNNCHYCHGSNTGATAPARPLRAQDYHGHNALVGGGLWPTVNARPYAFIRGWSGSAYQRPYRASEFTTGNATCGTGACPGGGQVGDGTTRTYTPGGTY